MKSPQSVTLTGGEVILEPLAARHLPQLGTACEPAFYEHMPGGPFALGGIEAWFTAMEAQRVGGRLLVFALVHRATGRAIGTSSLIDISVVDERLEIGGTWIARAHQRTAANTEMKLLLLRHCFDDLGAGRVALKTGDANVNSQRAIERIGGVREGVLRRHVRLNDGRWRDTVYYSILAAEWPAVRDRLEAKLAAR